MENLVLCKCRIPYGSQWFAAFNMFLLTIQIGICFGWITPFIADLSRPNPPFEVTKEQISWVPTLLSLSQPIGVILGTITATSWGSKITAWICGLYFAFAWILLIAANTIYVVLASLFMITIGIGVVYTIYPIYISEIASSKIRGGVIGVVLHGVMIGMFLGNFLGAYIAPWCIAAVNLGISVLFVFSFCFVPQTPYHLVRRGKMVQAEDAINWYDKNTDAKMELRKLSKFLEESPQLKFSEYFRELKNPITLKAMFMIFMIDSTTYLLGSYSLLQYAEVIFIDSKVTIIEPATLVTILTAVTIPFCWLSMYTIDRFGRVAMLITSFFFVSASYAGWGANFHVLESGFASVYVQYMSIICAFMYRIGMNIGSAVVPTLLGELYTPNIKLLGTCISVSITTLCMAISSKTFQYMTENLTYKYTFYGFAALMISIMIYIRVYVPETKGKSLQEIQEMLQKREAIDEVSKSP